MPGGGDSFLGSAQRCQQFCELAADRSVTIPPGVAHGFLALEQLELVYLVSNEFDGTDELGFAWDDPAVAFNPKPSLVV